MIQRLMKKREQEEGFTLVELLVVIVILGILAAIVVFAVGGIADKGQTSACSTDSASMQTAEESYYAAQKPVGAYGSEQALVDGGFLHALSTLHNITLVAAAGGNPATYTVAPVSPCT